MIVASTPDRATRGEFGRGPVSVLWITSGLGCDGDSIALTAATNPSLEDLLRGCLPGMPPVILLNPVLAYESGDEFMRAWWRAARGELDPFILVLEGSVPNEEINGEGHWAGLGVDPDTGQPVLTNTWIDRLAPLAAAVLALGTCAAYGGIPAMRNNPTGAMGLSDYLGRHWLSRLGLPIVNLPGCPVQPDNITETLLYLVLYIARMGPAPELDEQGRPRRIFDRTVHEGCDRAGLAEEGQFSSSPRRRPLPGQARLQGPGRQVQRADPRLDQRDRRVSERRRNLHGVHDAWIPRQVSAVLRARCRGTAVCENRQVRARTRRQVPARAADPAHLRRRTEVAQAGRRAHHRLSSVTCATEPLMPVSVVFKCEVCGARPDPDTQVSLERQLLDLRHGEYVDAEPGRWLTWHGRGMYGPQRYACGEHRGELKAVVREHYGTLGWHPWAVGPHPWAGRRGTDRARRFARTLRSTLGAPGA